MQKRIFLTEKQLFLLKKSLKPIFEIKKSTYMFYFPVLNEIKGNLPFHQLLALYLYRGYDYDKTGNKIQCKSLNLIGGRNPMTDRNSINHSYYFSFTFDVDGEEHNGLIRVSDHMAEPITFEKNNVKYGLSIVFPSSNNLSSNSQSSKAEVYEYIYNDVPYNAKETCKKLKRDLLRIDSVVIRNNKVIRPSEHVYPFKKINNQKEIFQNKTYLLLTRDSHIHKPGDIVKFINQSTGKYINAIKTKFGYKLSEEEKENFKIGDTLIYIFIRQTRSGEYTQKQLGKEIVEI